MNNLFCIAEKNGIIIDYCSIPKNVSLSAHIDKEDFILMDCSLVHNEVKEKTCLAHEMGHCMTGSFYNPYSELDIRKKHENKADKWAIQHLVSKDELEEAVIEGNTEIWQLAGYFDVTEDFMRKAICWYVHGNLAVDLYL